MKCDLVGLYVLGVIRLTSEICKTKLKREAISVKHKRLRDTLAKAKAYLDRLKHLEALLKNRHSKLVCWGL